MPDARNKKCGASVSGSATQNISRRFRRSCGHLRDQVLHGQSRQINEINDAIRTNIWYELSVNASPFLFPSARSKWNAARKDTISEGRKARAILRGRTSLPMPR